MILSKQGFDLTTGGYVNLQAVFLDYSTDAAKLHYTRALATLLHIELVIGYAPPSGATLSEEEERITKGRICAEVWEGREDPRSPTSTRIVREGRIMWPDVRGVIVSNHLQSHPRFPVWRPSAETKIRNAEAPILVPFGNKPELERGYRWGVDLAKQINTSVIFYHTTWPKDGVVSEHGKDHWHAGAEEVARRAEEYARKSYVNFEIVVDKASSVREGVHQTALSRCAQCVVAQQDSNVVSGGYQDELIRYGHLVPLVILSNGGV